MENTERSHYPPELVSKIDSLADEFEKQWRHGQVRIEDFLSKVDQTAQIYLFAELLALELELEGKKGQGAS